jgi:hypothetical protein
MSKYFNIGQRVSIKQSSKYCDELSYKLKIEEIPDNTEAIILERSGNDYGLYVLGKTHKFAQWWFDKDELTLIDPDCNKGMKWVNKNIIENEE